jgi:hypothetical protein
MTALGFRHTSGRRRAGRALATAVVMLVLVGATPATAEDYEDTHAGHPLRILAYVTHPIGVILDTLIFRPAHWFASHEPIKKFFGQRD